MISEFKQIQEPREARFRCLDINDLEKCELSAKEAQYLKLTCIESFLSKKVLYEIDFPPELKGETRYLKGPKVFQGRVFPELLITVRGMLRYRAREMDIGPQLIVARRIDMFDTAFLACPKQRLADTGKLRKKLGGPWIFLHVLEFWSHDIYLWHGTRVRPGVHWRDEFWTEMSGVIKDCSRPMNNIRIREFVSHVLGAYMDWKEFQWHYFSVDAAASGTQSQFGCWKLFARMEAQHDVSVAMAAGAQDALATRKHYACRKVLFDCVESNSAPRCVLRGKHPHPGWYVITHSSRGPEQTIFSLKLAGPMPKEPKPRGEPVMDGVEIYDKTELESGRLSGQSTIRVHGDSLDKTDKFEGGTGY
ncbi:hypothetical protein D6C77_07486 [Aureobasidium pullulans]|nr:hypothetical protein D6C77_07486 [Aureobasidium pullulans]